MKEIKELKETWVTVCLADDIPEEYSGVCFDEEETARKFLAMYPVDNVERKVVRFIRAND